MTESTQHVGTDPARPYVAGDHLELVVTVLDVAGDAVDISAAQSVRYAISRAGSRGQPIGAPLLTKSLGSGVVITNGAEGVFTVTLSSGDTDSLVGGYYHEAEYIDADGRVATVMRGQITIAEQALLPQ